MCGLNINKYGFVSVCKMMNISAIFTFLGTICHAQKGRVKPIVKKWIHFMVRIYFWLLEIIYAKKVFYSISLYKNCF